MWLWHFLGQGGSSATVVLPNFGTRSPGPLCLPPQSRTAVCSPPKTPVAKLQEYSQQNNLKLPEYKEVQPVSGGFRCTVTVRGKKYSGEIKGKKQDAKHSAAGVALQHLSSSSKVNNRYL